MKSQLILLVLHLLQLCATGSASVTWTADLGAKARLECVHGFNRTDIITWHRQRDQIVYEDTSTQKIFPGYGLEKGDRRVYLIIDKVQERDLTSYTCVVFYKGAINDYKSVEGELGLKSKSRASAGRGVSDPVKSSLAALLIGSVLQILLLAI